MRGELAVKSLREVKEVFDKLGIRCWLDWGTLLGAVRDGEIIEWDNDIDLGTMEDDWGKILSAIPELEKREFHAHFQNLKIQKHITFHHFGCETDVFIYQTRGRWAIILFPTKNRINRIYRDLNVLFNLLLCHKIYVRPKYEPVVKIVERCLSPFPPKLKKLLSEIVSMLMLMLLSRAIIEKLIVIPKHYFEKLGTIKFYGMTFNIPSNVEDYLKLHYGEDWKTPKKEWMWLKDNGTVRAVTTSKNS